MDDRKLQEFRVDYARKMKTKSKYMEHVELMDRYKAYKEKFIDSYDKVETYGDILKKEYKYSDYYLLNNFDFNLERTDLYETMKKMMRIALQRPTMTNSLKSTASRICLNISRAR